MKSIVVLVGGILSSCCLLSGQRTPEMIEQQRAIDAAAQRAMESNDPYVPLAEQEWARKVNADRAATTTIAVPIPAAPKESEQAAPPGTVSVKALRHPISSKSRKLIEKAEDQIHHQDYAAAEKTLNEAMTIEEVRPYALAIFGSMQLAQYIRTNRLPLLSASLAALVEAVAQVPDDVSAKSNLGLAYYYAGDPDNALKEASKALQMDSTRVKTRYVMGLILGGQRRYAEAAYHLKLAAPQIPAANELLQRIEQLAAESSAIAQK